MLQKVIKRLARSYSSEGEGSALKRRFEQLKESKPVPHHINQKKIDEIYERIKREGRSTESGAKFELKYQKEIGISKLPSYVSKQDKERAMTPHWTGHESYIDSSRRMLEDSYKPLKAPISNPLPLPKRKPIVSVSSRVSAAREQSLDYKVTTKYQNEDKTIDKRKLTHDLPPLRALGPSVLGPSGAAGTMSLIDSIASRRIEDAYARGQFNNIPRGKKIEKDHSLSNPHIDTTEYYLNRMIQKQGAQPPWIAKQMQVNDMIAKFRQGMVKDVLKRLVRETVAKNLSSKELVREKEVISAGVASQDPVKQWTQENSKYHVAKVNDINSAIRGYNLIAPYSARKKYLHLDAELRSVYQQVAREFSSELDRANGKLSIPGNVSITEKKLEHYGFKQAARDLWGTVRGR